MGDRSRSSSAEEKEAKPQDVEGIGAVAAVRSAEDELADAAAKDLYLQARLDPADGHGSPELAEAILGVGCIQGFRGRRVWPRGMVGWANSWIINVSECISARKLNHLVAH